MKRARGALAGNEAYEASRARGVMKDGRRFGKPPTPYTPPPTPEGRVDITDPDPRNVKTPRGYMQGYNAQAVCNENQIVVAAEINTPRRRRWSSPMPAIGTTTTWMRWRAAACRS